ADAFFFDLRGIFPIMVSYLCLAGIAVMISILAVERERPLERAFLFMIMLALVWSPCQFFNLASQFQVVFPIAHALALACLIALAKAKSGDRLRPWWLFTAVFCDFLAVFSSGAGALLLAPVIMLAIWLRLSARTIAVFVTFHLLMVGLYLFHY